MTVRSPAHARKLKFAQRNQARWRMQDMARKIFGLIFSENQQSSPRPASIEEGRSRTSRTWRRDAVDADVPTDERRRRGRRSRVVPTPRRWRQVLRRLQKACREAMVANKHWLTKESAE